MADQKINALPTKTSPSTGDKMLMIGTAEEYQIDYDQLATAILNKLSTQSFSSLDTTSKTVLGAIDELNSNIPIFSNAGSHNSIYRGQSLGSSVTMEQWNAIQAGTFDDMYIGDYWRINNVVWRIAAFDYFYNSGDIAFQKHHIVIVPDSALYSRNMNDTDVTTGAYTGSKLYTEGLDGAKTTIQNAFGSEHVLSHRIYLSNATSNGRASTGIWTDSIVDLMCEQMVYGAIVFSPVSDGGAVPANLRIEKIQLPVFAMNPALIASNTSYWLRDVISNSLFAGVSNNNGANSYSASNVAGVRPYFCIGTNN